METKTYTCIVCPKSCKGEMVIEEGQFKFIGYACKRGEEYAKNEHTNPKRMLTTTVKIENGVIGRLPVVSDIEIDKKRLIECIDFLHTQHFKAPVKEGDILLNNILGTGVSIIAAMDLDKKS